ncbi:hypothetical protein ABR737_04690 [Streptomyces sp. Edi2]
MNSTTGAAREPRPVQARDVPPGGPGRGRAPPVNDPEAARS